MSFHFANHAEDVHADSRTELIVAISAALKELQLEYALGHETAIIESHSLRRLCSLIGAVLRHFVRTRSGLFERSADTVVWQLLTRLSRREATTHISNLRHATSSRGKIMAWIRLAINENALESYLNTLSADPGLVREFLHTACALPRWRAHGHSFFADCRPQSHVVCDARRRRLARIPRRLSACGHDRRAQTAHLQPPMLCRCRHRPARY
eukprot:Opistho-2@92308